MEKLIKQSFDELLSGSGCFVKVGGFIFHVKWAKRQELGVSPRFWGWARA